MPRFVFERLTECLPPPSVGHSPWFRYSGRQPCQHNTADILPAQCGLFIPCKSGNRLEPPSHYSVSICIILICNGCIPSWFRVTIDELPPSATFNHMRCDYTLRLIEVLRPLQPLWYSRKIGTVLSTTPSTSCRSIDHLTLLSCLVSHQAGLHFYRMLLPLRKKE